MAADNKTIQLRLELEAKQAKANMAQTEVAINKLTQSFKKLTKGTNDYKAAQAKLAQLQVKYTKQTMAYDNSLKKMSMNMGAMNKASGGATSAVLELGRVVQDAPYGLRGMANNITQLASQMAFATKSAGSFKGALKDMWKSLAGPMGVIFVISLLVSAWEMHNDTKKTAIQLEKELKEAFTKTLEIMREVLWFSQERIDRSKEIIKLEEDIKDAQKRGDSKKELELEKQKLDLQIENAKVKKITLEGVIETSKGTERNIEAQKALFKVNSQLYKLERERARLDIDKAGKGSGGRTRVYRQQLLNLNKEFRAYIDENEKLTERSARNRLMIEQEANAKELEIKYNLYTAKQTQRHNDYLATVTDLKLREDAQNKHNEAMELAEHNYNATVSKLKTRNQTQLAEFDRIEEERQIQVQFKQMERELKHYNQLYEGRKVLFQDEQVKLEEQRLEEAERLAEMYDLGTKERFDADVAIANQRMNLRQAELDHETMIIEEKKRVNMEYIGFISQLGGIFQQLAGENEALATAALVIEKGAAIANVIVSTTAANREIINESSKAAGTLSASGTSLAGLSAAASAMGNPAQAVRLGAASKANFAAAATTTADGARRVAMNKVGAGISIAAILASTIKSSSGVGGGGASGGGGSTSGSREFDFNLVGSTGQNQLAQGIAGQFNQPIQAYVVSTQMSSQQQLDARIQSTASLGE